VVRLGCVGPPDHWHGGYDILPTPQGAPVNRPQPPPLVNDSETPEGRGINVIAVPGSRKFSHPDITKPWWNQDY
jgi:hypothetical protein